MIARVLVDIPNKNIDQLYDYLIPSVFEEILEVGARVIVSFGPRVVMGYCLEIVSEPETTHELKEIKQVLDLEPYLTEELILLAKKIRIDTSTVLIKVLESMVPSALKVVYQVSFQVLHLDQLSKELQTLIPASLSFKLTPSLYPYMKEIRQGIKNKDIVQLYDVSLKNKQKQKTFVLVGSVTPSKPTENQTKVLTYLKNILDQKVLKSVLVEDTGCSDAILKTMAKHQYITFQQEEVYRDVFENQKTLCKEVTLNPEQQVCLDKIIAKKDTYQPFLLHGVTGSGKTEIYIKMMEKVIKEQKQVLFLVSEIALTPMMVKRFLGHFNDQIALLHSSLSVGEKYDEWRRIIRNEVSIVIGARSACFAPLSNLGLIIIDECHESSYKQEEMPKYYAIDVCQERAKHFQIPLILGSATPNVESYARVKRGYYELLELKSKAMNTFVPDLEVVDMKSEFKSGNTSLFSNTLQTEIQERLDKKEQTILLLNRRGYSNFVICRHCGHVFECPNCDISLTYHDVSHQLKCHYCNHTEPMPKACPKCGQEDLRFMGSGTQKVEMELSLLYPSAKIIRMDNDTTRTKNAHTTLLNQFEEEGDILLGTQMIAKGLDFPKVTLVGIIQADGSLYMPDFRAPEKTFQLITQVAGRAGRHDLKGKVIIQAFNPNHYAIQYALNQDYDGFYQYEMRLRKLAKYIPFYFMIQILFSGESNRDLFLRAREVIKYLKLNLSEEAILLGPSLPSLSRVKGKHLCQVLIKYRQEPKLDELLIEIYKQFSSNQIYISIDRTPTLG